MSTYGESSPAAKVMDEAIELAIQGRSPYPERATFVDADSPGADEMIRHAAKEGRDVVLVASDGSTRILTANSVS